MPASFIGPSYRLDDRKADVQRSINLMPTQIESGSGKTDVFLEPIPGLRIFSVYGVAASYFSSYYDVYEDEDEEIWLPPLIHGNTDAFVGAARWMLEVEHDGGSYYPVKSRAAREDFLANLSAYSEQDFESYALEDPNDPDEDGFQETFAGTFTFANGIECAFDPTTVVRSQAQYGAFGRFSTNESGLYQYLEFGTTYFTLSPGAGAVGFYLTDIGDFNSFCRVYATDNSGRTYEMSTNTSASMIDGSSMFFGILATDRTFTRIEIVGDLNFVGNQADVFGLDQLVVATSAQVAVVSGGDFGYIASSWPDGYETTNGSHFNAVYSSNRFYDCGTTNTSGSNGNYWEDSEANSTSSGTFTASAKFGAGAYANVDGARLTLKNAGSNVTGGTGLGREYTYEGHVKRTGSKVGNGEIMTINGSKLVVRFDASNFLHIDTVVRYTTNDAGTGSVTLDLVSDAALTIDTWYHWRVIGIITYDEFGEPSNFVLVALFLNGVLQDSYSAANSTNPTGVYEFFLGTSTAGGITTIGGLDASNYTPCTQDDVRFSSVGRCYANFTAPTLQYKEIYPPGWVSPADE